MKDTKVRIIFLFSAITYVIASLSCLICAKAVPKWYGLLIGFLIMLVALVIHILARNQSPLLYIVSNCVNSIAIGFNIGAYYSFTSKDLSVTTPLILFLPYMTLSLMICVLIQYIPRKCFSGILCIVLLLGLFLLCIIHFKENPLYSYGFFLLLIECLYFVLCLRVLKSPRNLLINLSFTNFGIYLLVAVVVIIIISEGDATDVLFECFDIDIPKKKSRYK